jgi:hypothetical protein
MKKKEIVYLDYECTKNLSDTMSKESFVRFLEKRIIISTDDESHYYLMELRQENKIIKKNTKKLK